MFSTPPRYVDGLPQPARCLVMGVVNVTPDSFSDGGVWLEPTAAIAHGTALSAAGADLVDVGGESTRPGAQRPSVDVELGRVIPVVSELSARGVVVSIDTMRASVARQAVDAGASAVNDVSGGLADPAMLGTVADLEVPYIVMHWRAHSTTMQDLATYDDVVTDVCRELAERVDAALTAGIAPERIAVDPGLGFAKTGEHNWELLGRLASLLDLGFPVLLGASRKTFLGRLLASDDGQQRPVTARDDATAATSALAAAAGVWCVRVHDVARSLDAVQVASRWARSTR
ncbi:MAG: dihydropteroate synthase [Nocardioidaceae bacterium]|nr:dihydropteroate synthase [Nocardioidaceae bacterium]